MKLLTRKETPTEQLKKAAIEAALNALNDDQLMQILPQFVFAYIENCYFSESWWTSLSSEQQKLVTQHAGNLNPYYSVPSYEESMLVPWIMSERRMIEPT